MATSKIGYLDSVVNFYTWRCHKVSAGCKFCYAEERTERFGRGPFRGDPQWREGAANELRNLASGQVVGINFMSDTWHESVRLLWIQTIHQHVGSRPDCVFVYLTKRSKRLASEARRVFWPPNLWVGVSVEDSAHKDRIRDLLYVPTDNLWISFEPLLGPMGHLDLRGIGWVVTGGESGPRCRTMEPAWAFAIGSCAREKRIPWYHKQGNDRYPDSNRLLFGRQHDEVPDAFRQVREHYTPKQLGLF